MAFNYRSYNTTLGSKFKWILTWHIPQLWSPFCFDKNLSIFNRHIFKDTKDLERALLFSSKSERDAFKSRKIIVSRTLYNALFFFVVFKRFKLLIKNSVNTLKYKSSIVKYIEENKPRLDCQENEITNVLRGSLPYEEVHCLLRHEDFDQEFNLDKALSRALKETSK